MLKYFGTDGVRGLANQGLTAAMAYRIGRCLGQKHQNKSPRLLVCQDTRRSSEMLKSALVAGLLSSGAEIFDEGVSSTPSVSYLVRKNHFDYGVMISASHNPFADNGIKIFNGEGEKLEDEYEEIIEKYMDQEEDDLPLPTGAELGVIHDGAPLKEDYLNWLTSKCSVNLKGLKVLVDCANGSTSLLAPRLFARLGLEATFISATPDGININAACGSTHLESLQATFKKGHYDLGFAFDGDGDRFMALAPNGRLIDGDAQIFLQALRYKKIKALSDNKVVITVMSNLGLRQALDRENIGYEIVQVGDKNVQAALKAHSLVVGGEQSGHVIFLNELNTGDGLLSALELLNLYVGHPDIFAKLPSLDVFPQYLLNIPFADKVTLETVSSSQTLKQAVTVEEKKLGQQGRILVRESGTEPLLRIMVEALTIDSCHAIAKRIADAVKGSH